MRPLERLPENCIDLVDVSNISGDVFDWRDTVEFEHCDRAKRLQRIAQMASFGQPPEFFDGAVLADQLPSVVGIRIPILRVVFPDRIFFETDSSELRPEALEVVEIIAENLRREPPDVALFVAGHADARGVRAHNQNLSIDRANALANAVLSYGVNAASVWRVGFGEDMPLVAGKGRYAYGQNRRIEFLFAARPEPIAAHIVKQGLDLLCHGETQAETESCRAKLNFEKSYEIVELAKPSKPVRLDPNSDDAHVAISPQSGETKIVELTSPTRKITIHPTKGEYRILNPVNE